MSTMNSHQGIPPTASDTLPLTGERTVPHIDIENYWFTRHEIVYHYIAPHVGHQHVLEAGVGEGYGADILAQSGARVEAVDYDASVVEHISHKYPHVKVQQANLAQLPFTESSFDSIINLQVIEHLWDQEKFISDTTRLLKPGGKLYISTPNRLTFSPNHAEPTNHFHTREFSPSEFTQLLTSCGYSSIKEYGIFHGEKIRELDKKWNGSIITAQVETILANKPIEGELLQDIKSISYKDFSIEDTNLDDSLDLFYIASV